MFRLLLDASSCNVGFGHRQVTSCCRTSTFDAAHDACVYSKNPLLAVWGYAVGGKELKARWHVLLFCSTLLHID